MRKAESRLSTPGGLVVAFGRGILVFFGTTFAAHAFASGTNGGRLRPLGEQEFAATEISGADLPGYRTWLGEAQPVDSDLISAVINSAWMALVAITSGFAVGFLLALLARLKPLGTSLGLLTSPITAITLPGVLLLPIYRWAAARQYLPEGPSGSDVSASGSVWFVVFWGAVAGLALAPAIGGQLAGEQRYRIVGLDIATFGSAARTVAAGGRRFGLPITALLLSLASVELIAGSNGAFSYFHNRLSTGDLTRALDVVFVAAVCGAILTALIHLGAVFDRSGPGKTTASPPTKRSSAAWPLVAVMAIISLIAIIGYLRDPVLATTDQDQLLSAPSIGGPWLGTDDLGQSMVERLVIALGPTLLAGLLPAAMAAAIGVGLTRIVQRAPQAIGHAFDGLIDAVWWPLPLLLPLVHLYAGNPERSEFDLVVIAATGLMLVPLSIRIFGRAEPIVETGARTVMTTWLFLAGLGSSARILLGYMGVTNSTNGPGNADLGALISSVTSSTISSTSGSAPLSTNWPIVVTAITGVVLLSLLYWLAAAIRAPIPFQPLVSTYAPTTEQEPSLEPTGSLRRDGPLQPQDLRTIVRPVYDSDLPGDLQEGVPAPAAQGEGSEQGDGEEIEIDLRPEAPVTRRPVVNLVDQKSNDEAQQTPVSEAMDDPTAVAPVGSEEAENPAPNHDQIDVNEIDEDEIDEDEIDEDTQAELDMLNATSIDLAAQASQTIELRPSTLRRAGIIAPGATPPPERGNDRSILAEQAEDYPSGSSIDQQAEEQDED